MRYHLNLVTAPASEPVTTTEVKTFLRIDSSDEDTLLGNLITTARQSAEAYTGRGLITQTWQMFMDTWPSGLGDWWDGVRQLPITEVHAIKDIKMPKPPLQSITHIKTYDDDDSATTFSSSNYYVSAYSGDYARNGRMSLRNSAAWPSYEREADGIEIQFVCGYGDAASDVPQQIKQAILQEVAYLYENRAVCDNGCMCCNAAMRMLNPYKIIKL
jgi:uncharacterized phiE125 gp8 family phage protein